MKKWFNRKTLIALLSVTAVGVISIPLLTSCSGPLDGLSAANVINLIFPNLWVFIGQIISMFIIFNLIIFLIWRPTNKMIQRRRNLILSEIEQAKRDRELAATELANAKRTNIEAAIEAQQLIANANKESFLIREDASKRARIEANEMIDKANLTISHEYRRAQEDLNKEVIDIALKTAEELMKKKITIEDDHQLIENFIDDLKKDDRNA